LLISIRFGTQNVQSPTVTIVIWGTFFFHQEIQTTFSNAPFMKLTGLLNELNVNAIFCLILSHKAVCHYVNGLLSVLTWICQWCTEIAVSNLFIFILRYLTLHLFKRIWWKGYDWRAQRFCCWGQPFLLNCTIKKNANKDKFLK
jgi:hypothetical protein